MKWVWGREVLLEVERKLKLGAVDCNKVVCWICEWVIGTGFKGVSKRRTRVLKLDETYFLCSDHIMCEIQAINKKFLIKAV